MSSTPIAFLRANRSVVFLFVVLFCSLALNVLLGLKLTGRSHIVRTVGIQEDTALGHIPVIDKDGAPSILAFDGGRATVLYVIAPQCPWCARNLANIRALASARASDYRFIGLSNTESGFTDYVVGSSLTFPLYRIDAEALRQNSQWSLLKDLDPTPQMIVIDSTGRVRKVWIGALQGHPRSEAEQFFHTALPGLLPPAVTVPSSTP